MPKHKTHRTGTVSDGTARKSMLTLLTGFLAFSNAANLEAQTTPGPQPSICNRACWSARSPNCNPGTISSLNRAIIHHTAGGEFSTTGLNDSKARTRGIQNLDMDVNGWCDYSYHFAVDKYGNIFEGRSGSMTGLPRAYHDTCNEGFGYVLYGYFHPPNNNVAPQIMLDRLYDTIAWRMPNGWSPYGSSTYCGKTVGRLDGHRKVTATACPGDNIHPNLITENYNGGPMRNAVSSRRGGGGASSPIQLFSVSSDGLVTTMNDSAGRLVVFGLESDNTAGLMTQTSANGGWPTTWNGLGTWQHQMLALGKNADNRLEIFSVGSDNACNRADQTSPGGSWSGWNTMAGWMTKIATARNANGTQEVFGIGSDQKLYHTWQTSANGGWHAGWTVMGNYQHKDVIVGQNADGRLEVFTIGTDNACNKMNQTSPGGTWTGWSTLGGSFSAIGVGRNLDGRLEVFGISTSDQKLYHCWQMSANGGWHAGWDAIGNYQHKELVVGQNADGRLEVFTIGTDDACNRVNQTSPNGSWAGWTGMGGWHSSLAVGRSADGRQELFAIGSDKQMYHAWQMVPNGSWSSWNSMGGSFK